MQKNQERDPAGFFQGTGMPDPDWWEALWPDPADVLARLGLRQDTSAIDLCCGDGLFTRAMAKVARQVIGIDADVDLLERARRRLAEAGLTNCSFRVADAYDLPRTIQEPVDYVFLANTFHGAPDKSKLAGEVRDALKPGGLFAILNWHARPRDKTCVLGEPRGPATDLRMTPDQTEQAVGSSGLRCELLTDVSPFHYGLVFSRPS